MVLLKMERLQVKMISNAVIEFPSHYGSKKKKRRKGGKKPGKK